MIDEHGYRPNVGIIIANHHGQVLWARCVGKDNWQFPQGGIQKNEKPLDAAYRELHEETGLEACDVNLIASTRRWLRYVIPQQYRRRNNVPICIGQKQKWYLMQLSSNEERICLDHHDSPEFDQWRWVDYWHPLEEVVFFKRAVYRNALCELAPNLLSDDAQYLPDKYRTAYSHKA